MTCPTLKFDDSFDLSADAVRADINAAPAAPPARESPFETLVDEIDIGASRALAADGFGDC
jgi:hypothetical protein